MFIASSYARSEGAMWAVRLLVLGMAVLAVPSCSDPASLWEEGLDFGTFLEGVDSREAAWQSHYCAELPPDLLARARELSGSWRLLVVTEDWCGDSVNTVPYLAHLAREVDGLDLRVIDSKRGRRIMEAHRTPDGRAAISTLLVLDEGDKVVAAWVERPRELQQWWIENPEDLSPGAKVERKNEWYARDGGVSTLKEILRLVEDASSPLVCTEPAAG